jgi:Zn-dependent M16 (insulinase) family peptidase
VTLLASTQFREQSSTDMPRGVKIFKDVLGHWNYDRDPFLPLRYSQAFNDLKAEIKKDGQEWLLQLLTSRMFDSKHTAYLDLYPDKDYAQQWEKVGILFRMICYASPSYFLNVPVFSFAIDGSRVVA